MAADRGEIVITPTAAEADQLNRDLALLRENGAESNTQAILDAVRQSAQESVANRGSA